MPSLAELRDQVKTRYRITSSDLDGMIDDFINEAYRKLAQRFQWDSLLVENYAISLTGGTEQYTLPDNFWRMAQNGVRYDVSGQFVRKNLLVVTADDLQKWKLIQNVSAPEVCAIIPATSGSARRIEFQPSFSESKTVNIDYWKNPTELTEDSTELEIAALEKPIVYEALALVAEYHDETDSNGRADRYRMMARDYLKSAMQSEIVY